MKIFQYPEKLPINHTDFVYFQHQSYRTNASQKSDSGYSGEGDAPNDNNSIRLYMPNSTPPVSNTNQWGAQNFRGPLGVTMRNAGYAISREGGVVSLGDDLNNVSASQAGETLGSTTADLLNEVSFDNFGKVGGQLVNDAAAAALQFGSGDNLLAFSQGRIFNPNVELLYSGPQLRAFNMQFSFFARSTVESEMIDNIIKEFKMYSAPDDDGDFITVPHTWNVSYQMGSFGKHPKMNRFKKAALQSVSVQDNSSSNMHTTFEDGTPTVTTISLSFTEVDMIFRKDHETSNRGF